MDIKPIKSEQDYQDAIKRLEVIFDAVSNTTEGEELEVLGGLIDNFEKMHFPLELKNGKNVDSNK